MSPSLVGHDLSLIVVNNNLFLFTGSSSPSYVGAGLDAGECGARFSNLAASDSGSWSCHAGFSHPLPEQRASFNVTITGKHIYILTPVSHWGRQTQLNPHTTILTSFTKIWPILSTFTIWSLRPLSTNSVTLPFFLLIQSHCVS